MTDNESDAIQIKSNIIENSIPQSSESKEMKNSLPRYMRILVLITLCGYMAYNSTLSAKELNKETLRSAGCGKAQTGSGNYTSLKIRVLDADRSYHLRVPATYDPDRAYPIIFRWHGSGGNGRSGGFDIELVSGEDAIVVGADGINKYWGTRLDTQNLLFFDNMLEAIETRYCIDKNRIFSFGYSAGGFFSNMLACARGDVLRANAAIASGTRGDYCRGKVAMWLLHDRDDESIPIAKGRAARDKAITMNGCSTKSTDVGDGCIRYQGCEAAPVIWCESEGYGHNIRSNFAPVRVWNFFQGLP